MLAHVTSSGGLSTHWCQTESEVSALGHWPHPLDRSHCLPATRAPHRGMETDSITHLCRFSDWIIVGPIIFQPYLAPYRHDLHFVLNYTDWANAVHKLNERQLLLLLMESPVSASNQSEHLHWGEPEVKNNFRYFRRCLQLEVWENYHDIVSYHTVFILCIIYYDIFPSTLTVIMTVIPLLYCDGYCSVW